MPKIPTNGSKIIKSFDFEKGDMLANKFKIISQIGAGWEGQVYRIKEKNTGIERAAKIFFPQRNKKNKTSDIFAKKLNKLRESTIAIHYHTQETIIYKNTPVTVLISEYVEGEPLSDYIKKQPGKRLQPFQAIHLLHALISGIEKIHHHGEYHGDLHPANIIVRRLGLSFELKLLDFFHWGKANRDNRNSDIVNAIKTFYEALGGAKHYSKQPKEIKAICCGLKQTLILNKFKTASALRVYLETQAWS